MIPLPPPTNPAQIFSPTELHALNALRRRFQEGQEDLTERERRHLRFVLWLRQTGRLPL